MSTTATVVKRSVLSNGQTDVATEAGFDHAYIRGDPASRGPCPGLNALANHGYLPRDGKNLTAPIVKAALMASLHQSDAVAQRLIGLLPPYLRKDGTFDLVDTRRHNLVEHNASLTRLDFCQGDNYTFQPWMLEDIIRDANGGPITLRTLAKSFKRRTKESKAAGAPALSWKQWFVSIFNIAGIMNVAAPDGTVSTEALKSLLAEERFPEFALANTKTKGMPTFLGNAFKMMFWVVRGP